MTLTKTRGLPRHEYSGNLKAVKASPVSIKSHKIIVKISVPSIYTPANKDAGTKEDHGPVWDYAVLQYKSPESDIWIDVEVTDKSAPVLKFETEELSLFRLKRKMPDTDIFYRLLRPAYSKVIPLTDEEIAEYNQRKADHEATKHDRLTASITEAIKAECERRILEIAPLHKQRNMTAEMTQMIAFNGTYDQWTAEQQARGNELQSIFGRINALREASNAIEAGLEGKTFEQLQAFDINSGWPE